MNIYINLEFITGVENSKDVKNLLSKLKIKYIESTDFRLGKLSQSAPNGGCTHKNIYLLHPNAFRKIIMRCQNTDVYADYFTFIDNCCKYYNAYQVLLKEKYIITLREKIQDKDTTIVQKNDKIDTLSKEIQNQSLEIQKLLSYAINTNNVVSVLNENVESLTDDLQVNTNIISLAVVDRSLKPDLSDFKGLTCQFVILSNEIEYYVIRRQKRSIKTAINNVKDLYPIIVKTIDCS